MIKNFSMISFIDFSSKNSGGVSLILYGFIAVNGLKALVDNRVDFSNTRNIQI
jgi:xanthine/uracil permease